MASRALVSGGKRTARRDIRESECVLEAVYDAAAEAGLDVLSGENLLSEVIDGDALELLFEQRSTDAAPGEVVVAFEWRERLFVITGRAVEVYR